MLAVLDGVSACAVRCAAHKERNHPPDDLRDEVWDRFRYLRLVDGHIGGAETADACGVLGVSGLAS